MVGLETTARTRWPIMVMLVFAGPFLAQCEEQDTVPATPEEAPAVAPAPVVVPAAAPLGRSDLLRAFDEAASSFASGEAETRADPLVGRSFVIRLPFGCGGVQTRAEGAQPDPDGVGTVTWGSDGRSLILSLTPADWSDASLLSGGGDRPHWEAADGCWITQPWLRSEACPRVRTDPLQTGAATRSAQTTGLAAVFESDGSRIGRRDGRAYRHVVRGDDVAPPVASLAGYRARLSGRVVGFPNRRAVRCTASGGDQRPVCVAAIQLDEVAFETAEGTVLSRWSSG